jgi:group I intron endonuclease
MGWLNRRFGKRRGVYAIVNCVDGKVYIGSSTDLKKRAHDHLYLLRSNQHPNPHLQYAFNKNGEAAFEMRILQEVACEEELLPAEQYWMDYTQCYDHECGYNIDPSAERKFISDETRAKISAGNSGKTRSDAVRRKISASLKGHPLAEETRKKMMGRTHSEATRAKIAAAGRRRKHSPETRARLSRANRGRIPSDETRARMSKAHKGRPLSEQARTKLSAANKGKTISEETRAKISAARRRNPLSHEARIRMVEASRILTPEQVQEIRRRLAKGEAIRSIAEAYGVNYYTIWNILKGRTWTHLPLPDKE